MVRDIDPDRKVIMLESANPDPDSLEVPYDVLVLATGSTAPFPSKFTPRANQKLEELVDEYRKYSDKVSHV